MVKLCVNAMLQHKCIHRAVLALCDSLSNVGCYLNDKAKVLVV